MGNDVPYILVHLDHQVSRMVFDVVDVTTGKSRDVGFLGKNMTRNSGATTFFAIPWDGTVADGEHDLPNGTYRIELSVLKALGAETNPAHVQRWTSPNITIARPAPPTP